MYVCMLVVSQHSLNSYHTKAIADSKDTNSNHSDPNIIDDHQQDKGSNEQEGEDNESTAKRYPVDNVWTERFDDGIRNGEHNKKHCGGPQSSSQDVFHSYPENNSWCKVTPDSKGKEAKDPESILIFSHDLYLL